MTYRCLCWFVTGLMTVSQMHGQSERGIKSLARDPETGTMLQCYSQQWAIVIGIDKYQYWPHLRYAAKDAEAIVEVLTSKYGFARSHVTLLKDSAATEQGIKDALADLIDKANSDDGVIVFFAGHGQTYRTRDGREMGYLIPVDGRLEDSKLYTSAIPMSEIKNLSELIPAKHVLFLVDACYSGLAAAAEFRGAISEDTKGFLKKIVEAKTRHIITAGGGGEQVQERDEWGHSAFTYELLNALDRRQADRNNDGIITSDELAEYLTSRVTEITQNAQIPQSKRLSMDEGKFVFICGESFVTQIGGPSQTSKPELSTEADAAVLIEKIRRVVPIRAGDVTSADAEQKVSSEEQPPSIVRLEFPKPDRGQTILDLKGSIVVNVLIDETGKPIGWRVLTCTNDQMIGPVTRALMNSKFKPGFTSNGPLAKWVAIPFKIFEP